MSRSARGPADPMEHRERERGRLPGAGGRLAQDVATGQERRNRLALDRRGFFVAQRRKRAHERRGEPERGKAVGGGRCVLVHPVPVLRKAVGQLCVKIAESPTHGPVRARYFEQWKLPPVRATPYASCSTRARSGCAASSQTAPSSGVTRPSRSSPEPRTGRFST